VGATDDGVEGGFVAMGDSVVSGGVFVSMVASICGWRVMFAIAIPAIKPPITKLPKITAGFCQLLSEVVDAGIKADFWAEAKGWVCWVCATAGDRAIVD